MGTNIVEIIKKYKVVLIIVIVVAILVAIIYPLTQLDSDKVKLSSLSSFNVRQLLAKNNDLYFYNGSQIVRTTINDTSSAQVIDNDVVFVNASTNGKRIYYVKGIGRNAKSYIFNLDQNTKKEYKQYDAFFWVDNNGKFVEFAKNTSNILNESLGIEYRNLVYPNFDSYSGIILGSTVKTSPELEGYRWDVVNKDSTNIKNLEILNAGSRPWVVNNYMAYLADDNKFNTINKHGQRVTSEESINYSQLTYEDGDQQMFAKFDKNNVIVGDINLKDGKVVNKRSYKVQNLIKNNSINTTKQTQAYLYNNTLYVVVDNKVLEVEL